MLSPQKQIARGSRFNVAENPNSFTMVILFMTIFCHCIFFQPTGFKFTFISMRGSVIFFKFKTGSSYSKRFRTTAADRTSHDLRASPHEHSLCTYTSARPTERDATQRFAFKFRLLSMQYALCPTLTREKI
jgi:hypothetical protein